MSDALERRLSDAWVAVAGPDPDTVEAALARVTSGAVPLHRPVQRRTWRVRWVGSLVTAAFVVLVGVLFIAGPGRQHESPPAGQQVSVPVLLGQPIGSVTGLLQPLGLRWRAEPVESDQPAGTIIEQKPSAGSAAGEGSSVLLRFAVPGNRTDVPDTALDVLTPTPELPGDRRLQQLHGEVVVLAFVASWCVPCLSSGTPRTDDATITAPLDVLAWLHSNYVTRGVLTVPVATNDAASDARTLVPDDGVLPLVADPIGAVGFDTFKVTGLPSIVVLDRHGRIAWRSNGLASVAQLSPVVDALAREPIPAAFRAQATALPLRVLSGPALSEDQVPASLLTDSSCLVYPDQVYRLGGVGAAQPFYLARGPRDWTISVWGGALGCGPARDLVRALDTSPAAMVFASGSAVDDWSGAYIVRDGFDTATIGARNVPIQNNALLIDNLESGVYEFAISGPAGRATIKILGRR
jgi:thiol-disulfide isomerase/thioredoxin